MTYTAFEFFTRDEIERSMLMSLLNDYQFEGYEETEDSLKAFVPSDKIENLQLNDILRMDELGHIRFSTELLEEKNWNEEWEKNFEPVLIAGRVGIRAPFHLPMNSEIELVIEPKMSFGTGHHPTTSAVIEMMLAENFRSSKVLDFGSGTGVLAILAEKLGAEKILAIDHEEWAFNNCVENVERNACLHIRSLRGSDILDEGEKCDFVLANINRNVILDMIGRWAGLLKDCGKLIVSGILKSDENDVIEAADKHGLGKENVLRNKDWSAISLVRR